MRGGSMNSSYDFVQADIERDTRPVMKPQLPGVEVVSGFNDASAAMDAGDDALYDQIIGRVTRIIDIPQARTSD
jgi:hypothetical protein